MPNDQLRAADRPEAPAVATRIVLFIATGLVVFVAISLVLLQLYYGEQIRQAVVVPPTPFAKPELQANQSDDLAKLQAEQRKRLASYAWVDRDKGVIAVPIEEAMKQIVARGADAYAPIGAVSPVQKAGGGKQP